MYLRLVREGAAFTIYALEMGDTLHQFLAELEKNDLREHDRILARLDQLAERGASRRKDEFNDLGDGLYEAKTSAGCRVVFFYEQNQIIICTNGFIKKSRKTPRQLLKVAKEHKRAYKEYRQARKPVQRIIISATQEKPRRMP